MMRNLAVSFLALGAIAGSEQARGVPISRILGGDPPSAALEKLEAASLRAVLANVGGRDLYLSVFRDRDPRALKSDALRNVRLRRDPRSWRS